MKSPLLLLTFIICNSLHGQSKFLEITVQDTVLVKADFFVYHINSIAADNVESIDSTGSGKAMPEGMALSNSRFVQKAFDSLIADLKKRGFRILPRTFEDSFRIMSNRYTIYSANIYLRSIDSVSQLYGILKNEKYLGGAYLVGQAQNESDCRNKLYKKILEKASAKAKMMAGSSNRKIAGVMSITENKSDEDKPEGGWIVYPSLSAPRMSDLPRGAATALSVPDSIANESDIIQFYPIHASFTIRFSLE